MSGDHNWRNYIEGLFLSSGIIGNAARRVILTVHLSYLPRIPDAKKKAEGYLRFVEDLRLAT